MPRSMRWHPSKASIRLIAGWMPFTVCSPHPVEQEKTFSDVEADFSQRGGRTDSCVTFLKPFFSNIFLHFCICLSKPRHESSNPFFDERGHRSVLNQQHRFCFVHPFPFCKSSVVYSLPVVFHCLYLCSIEYSVDLRLGFQSLGGKGQVWLVSSNLFSAIGGGRHCSVCVTFHIPTPESPTNNHFVCLLPMLRETCPTLEKSKLVSTRLLFPGTKTATVLLKPHAIRMNSFSQKYRLASVQSASICPMSHILLVVPLWRPETSQPSCQLVLSVDTLLCKWLLFSSFSSVCLIDNLQSQFFPASKAVPGNCL